MRIQCPPSSQPPKLAPPNLFPPPPHPLYKSASGKRFIQNKLWNCTLLAQQAPDCAFVGLDVDGAPATQLGLVYLPRHPSPTPLPADLIRGQRPPDLMRNFGAEVWCLNLEPPEEAGRPETPENPPPPAVRLGHASTEPPRRGRGSAGMRAALEVEAAEREEVPRLGRLQYAGGVRSHGRPVPGRGDDGAPRRLDRRARSGLGHEAIHWRGCRQAAYAERSGQALVSRFGYPGGQPGDCRDTVAEA
ncbi:uncharacterized protein PG986_005713 [Apiospora aurea]|uniref:Uncharacterized protein n=1 Tax=Apiospora aurea TaxID=335848 RepID=A0ABR1QID5_9PEZI